MSDIAITASDTLDWHSATETPPAPDVMVLIRTNQDEVDMGYLGSKDGHWRWSWDDSLALVVTDWTAAPTMEVDQANASTGVKE